MSERAAIAAIAAITIIMVTVIVCLTFVLIYHDGSSEGDIVTALIGLPTVLIAAASPILAHWLTLRETRGLPPAPPAP